MNTIAYFINTFLRLSEGFIYEQLINYRNFHVEVFTRDRLNAKLFPYDNVNSLRGFERLRYAFFRQSPTFDKLLMQKDIKLIHAHFGADSVYALPFAKKYNLPLVVTFHGQDITRLPKFTLYPVAWFNYWLHFRELQRNGALFIGVSNFISGKMIEKGFPSKKVITHYLGIDTDVEAVRPNKDKIALTVARLVEKKGTEYLIRACARLVPTMPDIKLIICGDGPLKSKLVKLATQLGIKDNVDFVGWKNKSEVQALMKKARVFALTSVTAADGDSEGLAMVFLEAMMLGIPCIGTRHGGIPDVVNDNNTGFLVNEKDSTALAEKLELLLTDYSLCEKFGSDGRKVVADKFDIKKQVLKLEDIYRGLIKI